jgi:hypothetical protein
MDDIIDGAALPGLEVLAIKSCVLLQNRRNFIWSNRRKVTVIDEGVLEMYWAGINASWVAPPVPPARASK